MKSFFLLITGFGMMTFLPVGGGNAQPPDVNEENFGSDVTPLTTHFEFPLLEHSDDFSDITGGIGWDVRYDLPVTRFSDQELSSGLLTSDGAFAVATTGAWLLNESINQQPLKAQLFWDFGFEMQPRIIGNPSPGLFNGEVETSDIGFWNWLYNYRFAFTLEAGSEAVQSLDVAYFSVGPGLRIINLEHSGWKGILPTLALYYEGVFELNNDDVRASAFNSEFSRFRLVHRHKFDFGWFGLTDLSLAGGYQYTRDIGQSPEYKEADYDSRLGWFADLSYAIRWSRRQEKIRRIDPFTRITTGRIAPLIEADKTFIVGIRIPYITLK